MAVISLDFSSTLAWANVMPWSLDQMLTKCRQPRPAALSAVPREDLPSMEKCLKPSRSAKELIQAVKQFWKAIGFSTAKTRLKVSWLGMPLGSFRKRAKKSFFALPNSSMVYHESASHSTAHRAMTMTSVNSCLRARWSRGSRRGAKCWRMEAGLAAGSLMNRDPWKGRGLQVRVGESSPGAQSGGRGIDSSPVGEERKRRVRKDLLQHYSPLALGIVVCVGPDGWTKRKSSFMCSSTIT